MNIKSRLEKLLWDIRDPGRYLGGEAGRVTKDPAGLLADMVLLFPDVYEMGMSHHGSRILYGVVNREPDLAAERCYAPQDDFAAKLRAEGVPLYSLETYRPLSEFKVVGITLQTELNYTNVPWLLELGGIPALAAGRTEAHPLVIGGGPCMANPEPVADFFDLFVIGDGERLLPEVLRIIGRERQAGSRRSAILETLSHLDGVYVPSLWPMVKNQHGELVPEREYSTGAYQNAGGIKRVWLPELTPADATGTFPIPNTVIVHNRFAVEIMRGCTNGCRFCQAGYWYRPSRELNAEDVLGLARQGLAKSGQRELGLLSLSTSDHTAIRPLAASLMAAEEFRGVNLSFPSLRVDTFGDEMATALSQLGGETGSTFAVETGSARLRRMINKNISDVQILDAARRVFRCGYKSMKVYLMIGLPTEGPEDMEATVHLLGALADIASASGRNRSVHAHLAVFIPKPFTPMQWAPFIPQREAEGRIGFLRGALRHLRNFRLTWTDWELACVETFYARGDRSAAAMILAASRQGEIFETFTERFRYSRWLEIWKEHGYSPERILAGRELEEILPWDVIHAGVSKTFLKREQAAMSLGEGGVEDCKTGSCHACGIPGAGKDNVLSAALEPTLKPDPVATGEVAAPAAAEKLLLEIRFSKLALARFLPHHAVLQQFERAIRLAGAEIECSLGMKPKPLLKNHGALPLGMGSRAEYLHAFLRRGPEGGLAEGREALNRSLPDGLRVEELRWVASGKVPLVKAVLFAVQLEALAAGSEGVVWKAPVEKAWEEAGRLHIRFKANESGSPPSPYPILAEQLGFPEVELRRGMVEKLEVEFG